MRRKLKLPKHYQTKLHNIVEYLDDHISIIDSDTNDIVKISEIMAYYPDMLNWWVEDYNLNCTVPYVIIKA